MDRQVVEQKLESLRRSLVHVNEKCPQVTAWQLCRTACNPAVHEVFAWN